MPQVFVAALATGIGAGIAAPGVAFAWGAFFASFMVTGLSSGILYLLNKPKQSGGSRELISRTVRSASMPKRYIYGDPICSGLLAFACTPYSSKRKHIIYIVIVFASHKVHKIGEIKFNDKWARDPETYFEGDNEDWTTSVADWDVSTAYTPGNFVKYHRDTVGDTETRAVWRNLDGASTIGTPPPDEATHWEEVGWWYSVRRYYGDQEGNNENGLDETFKMLGKDFDHNIIDETGTDVTTATNTYLEDGLGYIDDTAAEGLIWDESMQFKGLAYIVVKMRFNAARKTFPNGIPDIKAKLQGFDNIYDPVTETTGYTKNPVLCAAHYICSPHGLNRGFSKTYAYEGDTHVPANDLVDWDTVKVEAPHCDVEILSDHYGRAFIDNVDAGTTNATITDGVLTHDNGEVNFLTQTWYKVLVQRQKELNAPDLLVSNGVIPTTLQYPRIKIKSTVDDVVSYYIGCIRKVEETKLYLDIFETDWSTAGNERIADCSLVNDWEWAGENDGETLVSYADLSVIDDYIIYMEDSVRKRYELSGVVCADEKPITVINQMALTMAGTVTWVNGKYRILAGQYRSPVAIIQERDFQTPLTVVPLHSRKDVYNIVRGTVIDKTNADQKIDFPEITKQEYIDADEGLTYYNTLDFAYVDNQGQAQRVSQIALNKFRSEITVGGTGKFTLFPLGVTENVRLESYTLFPEEPNNRKIFCISSWELSPPKKDSAGGIVLSLTEDNAENYAVDVFNQPSINCTTDLAGTYTADTTIQKDPIISQIRGKLFLKRQGDPSYKFSNASISFVKEDFALNKKITFYCEIDYTDLTTTPTLPEEKTITGAYSVVLSGTNQEIVTVSGFSFVNKIISVNAMDTGYRATKIRYRNSEDDKIYIGFVKQYTSPTVVTVYADILMKQPGWQSITDGYTGPDSVLEIFVSIVDVINTRMVTSKSEDTVYTEPYTLTELSGHRTLLAGVTTLWVSGHYTESSVVEAIFKGSIITQDGESLVPAVNNLKAQVIGYGKPEVILGSQFYPVNISWDAMTNTVTGVRLIFSVNSSAWLETPTTTPYNDFRKDKTTADMVYYIDIPYSVNNITIYLLSSEVTKTGVNYKGRVMAKAYFNGSEKFWSDETAIANLATPISGMVVSGVNQKPAVFTYNSLVSLEPEIQYLGENDQYDSFINEFDISECYTTISYSPGTVRLWINGIEMYPYIANKTTGESGIADTWEFKEDDLVNYIKLTTKNPIPAGSKCLISYKAKQYATV